MGKVVSYRKLFLSIFYLEFLDPVRSPFLQISLNFFKVIQINTKPYCASERFVSISSRAGPRAFVQPRAHAC
jgi:hypothetical protein